jgi:hypothetical protein
VTLLDTPVDQSRTSERTPESAILAEERRKIIKMLTDVADLKFFSRGTQRRRLEDLEQTLRFALLHNVLELEHLLAHEVSDRGTQPCPRADDSRTLAAK